MSIRAALLAWAASLAFGLSGCGGQEPGQDPGATLSGRVSQGGITSVLVTDSSSPARQASAEVAADGFYSVAVADLAAPYLLEAGGLSALAPGPGLADINALTTVAATASREQGDAPAAFRAMAKQLETALAPLLACYTGSAHGDGGAGEIDFRAMDHEVAFSLEEGVLTVADRATGQVVLQAPLAELDSGLPLRGLPRRCGATPSPAPQPLVVPAAQATAEARAGAGTNCLSPVKNTIVIAAGKDVKDSTDSRATHWPLGAVELEFVTCKATSSARYAIAPAVYPMRIENYTVNLETRKRGPQTTYVPVFNQGQVPNMGHGLFYDTIIPPASRGHPTSIPAYTLRLQFMGCGPKPLTLKEAGLASAKAVASMPLPVSYVKSLGLFALSQVIPAPNQKFQCFAVGNRLDLGFVIEKNGKARFVPYLGEVKRSYSYRARHRKLGKYVPVRVDVALEALVPARAI